MGTSYEEMKKEEMMRRYYTHTTQCNYEEAQLRIQTAMMQGELYVLLPGKNGMLSDFRWTALPETIERLKNDGFDIDKVWDPWEYWSVEWGY